MHTEIVDELLLYSVEREKSYWTQKLYILVEEACIYIQVGNLYSFLENWYIVVENWYVLVKKGKFCWDYNLRAFSVAKNSAKDLSCGEQLQIWGMTTAHSIQSMRFKQQTIWLTCRASWKRKIVQIKHCFHLLNLKIKVKAVILMQDNQASWEP